MPRLVTIAEAVDELRHGQPVAFPTETVYALAADALDPHAVQRVYDLKGRTREKPLAIQVPTVALARPLWLTWPEQARTLTDRFWPGPLTIILPKTDAVPAIVAAGGTTVGVRCPDHPVALELLQTFAGPVVAPSANTSGRTSPTTAQQVLDAFAGADLAVVDGGPCPGGIESTVLSLEHPQRPTILRPGPITRRQIAQALGREVVELPSE